MKGKKIVSKVILTVLCILGIVTITTGVNAASQTSIFGIEEYRKTKGLNGADLELGYKALDKVIWKICSYDSFNASEVGNQTRALYCIKAGPGFGSNAQMGINGNIRETYQNIGNFKNYNAIESPYSGVIPSGDDYRSLVWLLEHCYVPGSDDAEYKASLLQAAGVTGDMIDSDIDVAQQLAVWHFTNRGDEYFVDTNGTFQLAVKTKTSDYVNLESTENNPRNTNAVKLFQYLVKTAELNKNTEPNTNTSANTISIVSTNAKAEKITTSDVNNKYKYILGPYKLETASTEYTLEASLKDSTGADLTYTILDSNKQVTTSTLKDLEIAGEEFYLQVNATEDLTADKINGAKFKVKISEYNTTLTFWSVAGADRVHQPVVEIERTKNNPEAEVTISYKDKIFDLALRKYITKVNNVNVTNTRNPSIVLTNLKNGTDTTATYRHRKDPVIVNNGTKVTYKITIYNEGEQKGYATKVVDQLPTGLKFNSVVSGNFVVDNYDVDSNKVTFVREAGKAPLNEFNGTTLASETIEIECEVTATANTVSDQILTNVAWISEEYNSDLDITITNQVNKDRDSEPATKPNVNKDNMSNYKGNSSNKANLADRTYFYKGEQDDDDFEKLIIEKETPNEYNLFLVKEDADGEQLDKAATFEVNGETKTVTGRLQVATNVPINETNVSTVDTYVIKELVPPDKYCKFDGIITITVTKKNDNGTYKVDEVNYTVKNSNGDDITTATGDTVKVYLRNGNIYVEVKNYQFDMALRKYILKINNQNVQVSRVPVISDATKQDLADGEVTTVTKEHTKDPLTVAPGDTVLYEIRVYNEGEVAGYVKEITDYLPAGLALKENSTINAEYGWTNPSGDGKTIVSTKIANELINAFDGTTLDSKAVQVECVVIAEDSQQRQSLKNVAEITKHADKNNNEDVVDRDSTPKNLTPSQLSNYNPGTSTRGWGYEDDDDYEELVIPAKEFDLALRKFITNVDGKEITGTNSRVPNVDVTALANNASVTTADYKHRKDPVRVKAGSIVIYTLRIYNEGSLDGYASKVTDYLPPELEFVTDDEENFNATYGWELDRTLRKVTTTKLARTTIDPEENLIKAFDKNTMTDEPDYVELKIKCRVKSNVELYDVITNIAEITDCTDKNGNPVTDRDSQVNNVVLPSDENLPDYKGNTSNKSILNDKNYHYKGQQDDDDFEKLIVEEFDLALRKFITGVNDTRVTNRIPVFTTNLDQYGNYIYEHTKEPVEVESTDIVEYTIRIFNEGNINGYASLVKDDIPDGLEFIPNDSLNIEYRWKMLDEDGNETNDVTKAKDIITDYLSKEQEKTTNGNLLRAFNKDLMTSPDYRDVKVNFKVVAPNTYDGIITNKAQISDDTDEEGHPVEDIDSTPDVWIESDDDQDVEHIKLSYFDLALRKFITGVNDTAVTNRIPVFKIDENGKYVYEHTKEPVEVENSNVVTYTIRVYNEGKKAGYAKLVKDDIPEGLEFLPDHELNREYRWVMVDENDEEVESVNDAVSIVTDYLSKAQETATGRNNLLIPFDKENMTEPDYRDVKVAFKVTEPNTSDRIIINKAQISDDSDKNDDDVTDIDSTPNVWIDNEDDQDIEKIKVKYFDLALRKWVTQAIVIQDGKEVVKETGHKAEDDPEDIVKVEIVESKLNKVVVKFRYKIRVTNEGQIAGYVDEISDYIPEGLKFVKADNPKWEEVEGKVVTDQLKGTLLNPGDSAEVEILLTWINGKNNLGLKVNVAEISKDRNDSNSKDIDSTPNNKKEGEDDIDDAPVILTVKTGEGIDKTYIFIAAGVVTIIGLGVFFIKKYVL